MPFAAAQEFDNNTSGSRFSYSIEGQLEMKMCGYHFEKIGNVFGQLVLYLALAFCDAFEL